VASIWATRCATSDPTALLLFCLTGRWKCQSLISSWVREPQKRTQPLPRPGGPARQTSAQPGRAGYQWMMITSAVGAAPFASAMTHTPKQRLNVANSAALLPQPDSHRIGRGTNSSNKLNATESTNQLIWTALVELSPGRQSWVGCEMTTKSRRDGWYSRYRLRTNSGRRARLQPCRIALSS
jgi:hypothetical protein